MKISIIVPAYNEEARIAETLTSLKQQIYPNLEIIVIDNNSRDRTGEIAKKYTEHVYVEKDQGYIAAVNRGAKEATGDLITFCDADTLYPKEWLSQIAHEFNLHSDAVAVYGGADTYDSNKLGNWINGFFYNSFLRLSRALGLDNTSGFNFVMKRSAYIEVGGYDPKYKKMSPDIELGKRISSVGKVVFTPRITVHSSFRRYQDGGVAQTQLMFIKGWWSMLRGNLPDLDYASYNVEVS